MFVHTKYALDRLDFHFFLNNFARNVVLNMTKISFKLNGYLFNYLNYLVAYLKIKFISIYVII